ncbi:hypothetical protein AMELA_G00148200 [Ameiurus melas]|uniref:Uncharacterized protein n=1 Tax=Ameiurus melas TaxID=219545 RepID=A0A7J6AHP7_AMEME|nr:hypothetical protein AMELA_G00148200 [Ameiurus melas]
MLKITCHSIALGHGEPGAHPREHWAQAGYTLDRVPVHRRAQSHIHSHTHSYTTDTLDMPISLPCMSLDWGRKPPQHGENMQTPHRNGPGSTRATNPGGVKQTC